MRLTLEFSPYLLCSLHSGNRDLRRRHSNGWIEDTNWGSFDMAHAIMPTETLTRLEVQEETLGVVIVVSMVLGTEDCPGFSRRIPVSGGFSSTHDWGRYRFNIFEHYFEFAKRMYCLLKWGISRARFCDP